MANARPPLELLTEQGSLVIFQVSANECNLGRKNLPKPSNGIPSRSSGETSRATARVATNSDIGESFGVLILRVPR